MMAQNYYTNEHFELLDKWKGSVYNKADPEQKRAYDALIKAYDVTKQWAEAVQQKLFKDGRSKTVRKPIDQWQKKFTPYLWGRIYPSKNAPEGLAYTVEITAELGFIVKIDLVDHKIKSPGAMRWKYEQIRGPITASAIASTMSAADGLALDFTTLVDWSVDAIKKFKISYDDLADQLGLSGGQNQESLLSHFQGNKDFCERQPRWTAKTTELFVRLARSVNKLGLDWWFTNAKDQLRFGRKETGVRLGAPVGWLNLRKDGIFRVSWNGFAGLDPLESADITIELVQRFEAADKEKDWPSKLGERSGRNGYWPDDYEIEDEAKTDNAPENIRESVSSGAVPRNIIYFGPPGTGKTFELQRMLNTEYDDAELGKCYEFVTFHQSYGYEEFIEGLRPVIGEESTGDVRYKIIPGAFLRLCERARENPSRQYAMVIDEINRGNVSKIFGELITLVEVDKREGAKHSITLTLPYSGAAFSVPLNVDVIGTMNTADRSLAVVDTALRRRFEFIECSPKPMLLAGTTVSHNGVDINVEQLLTVLNKRIEALYDRNHTVGHAYFTSLIDLPAENRFKELKTVFKNKVIPLLEEYFFEDWQKIRLVLGDNQKPKDHQFVHETGREDDLMALFGRDNGLDQYSLRARYQLNAEALDHPEAYAGIYAAKPAAST